MSKPNKPAPDPQPSAAPLTALALPTNDELAALGDMDFGDDGLGPLDRDDLKLAAYVLNMAGTSKDGRAIPKDEFYNTVDERSKHKVNAVFLHRHKSNLYSRWIESENRTEIVCRSFDRVTGTLQESQRTRPCKGCPDAEWHEVTDGDGKTKRKKNCSEVYNIFAVDTDESLGFVVRFKRTSLPVIRSYLAKHHIGRRLVKGERSNYPLHVFAVEMTGKMTGTFAVPVINRGRVLSGDEITIYKQRAQEVRDHVVPILMHVESQAARAEGRDDEGGGGGNGGSDQYAEGAGQDFVAGEGEDVTPPTDSKPVPF
jgi:hypothetical protein